MGPNFLSKLLTFDDPSHCKQILSVSVQASSFTTSHFHSVEPMTTLSAATTALVNETGESSVVLPTSSMMPQTSSTTTTCSPPPAAPSTGDAMMCDDHDVKTNDTMMHHPTNDTASYTNALHDAVAVSVSNSTSAITRDESTQGALDALATLAAASPLHATNHHHHGEEPQEITPHLTSGSSDNDDDSEIMPPPPPRNPTTLLGVGGGATSTSVSFLQDNASMSVSNHGFAFLHDVGSTYTSTSSIPPPPSSSSCTNIAPISTGRLRSASNPEGMEKWDYYSRRNDRQHFVLPSSILEEELASTRRVLGEAVDADEDDDDIDAGDENNNGEYNNDDDDDDGGEYNNNNNRASQHGFSFAPQTNYGTEQLQLQLQPKKKKDGFQQHWVRRSQRSSAGKRSDSLLGTSPDSVSDSLDGVNKNGSSNTATLTRSRGGAKSKVTTTTATTAASTKSATTTNKASASTTIKKKSTTTKTTKKNSRLNKSSQSSLSSSPQLLISTTDQTEEDFEQEELDESQLEPEELLRRARSRLLEDLSESNNSNSSSHGGGGGGGGGGGDKGSVLMLPHSLGKYKEVYNKNGRIGIYTPAERAAIIQKFNAKRARRVWNKKIRYNCRKNLADRRMRVKGRFVKRSVSEATNGGGSGGNGSLVPPEGGTEKEEGMGVTQKATAAAAATTGAARSNSPPTSGSPLATVNEHGEQQPPPDEEMPDVDDVEAGFDPSEDMPYRRTRRYTIT